MSKLIIRSFFLFILIGLISCEKAETKFDLIIENAIVFNGETYDETEQTIFIRKNKIVDVVESKGYARNQYLSDQYIDAKGHFVMPGLIEGHGHFLSYGEGLSQLKLEGYKTWDEIVDAVAERASELPEGTWIEGRGWHQEKWDKVPDAQVQGYPLHESLSERTPNHPVYLTHASGHAAFANQQAMDLVGITAESVSPAGGRILKDASGNVSGVFEENSVVPFEEYIRETKDLESIWEDALVRATASCLENGITSFQDAGSSIQQIRWFHKKAKNNELKLRLSAMALDSTHLLNQALPEIRFINAGDSFFTSRAIKTYFDGALGSRGAWLLEAYADQPGYFGQNTMNVEELQTFADICVKYDMQYCIHAIGDKANRLTLDLIEKNTRPGQDHRWRIEHAQHIDKADQPRFATIGAIASMQPIHCTSDAPFVGARLGKKRAQEGAYVWKNLLNLNARLAIGTDVPVESINPFENMYAAITRKRSPEGEVFFNEQRLTRKETLSGYTTGNAYAVFEESFKGQIKKDFIADICILDQNLMTCSEDDIPKTKVLKTIINGQVVFDRD